MTPPRQGLYRWRNIENTGPDADTGTWIWDGTDWTMVAGAYEPAERHSAVMACY